MPPFLSLDFGLRRDEPHLLHFFALRGLRALQFMHMSLLSILASASGNRAMVVKEGIFINIWLLGMLKSN